MTVVGGTVDDGGMEDVVVLGVPGVVVVEGGTVVTVMVVGDTVVVVVLRVVVVLELVVGVVVLVVVVVLVSGGHSGSLIPTWPLSAVLPSNRITTRNSPLVPSYGDGNIPGVRPDTAGSLLSKISPGAPVKVQPAQSPMMVGSVPIAELARMVVRSSTIMASPVISRFMLFLSWWLGRIIGVGQAEYARLD